VTTFVNVDDLYSSSTFGRMVGEQLMSELAMKGFDVIELRHTDALQFLDRGGEFALSRDAGMVRPERNLAGVVVGTYVASPERVYVNARLIDPSTSVVLSAGSVEMSKTPELTKLLRGGSLPGSLERIPVRHLGNVTQQIDPTETSRRRWSQEEGGWDIPQIAPVPSSPSAALPSAPVSPKSSASAPKVLSQPEVSVKDDGVGPVVKVQ
jgi:TolB-like protein